MSTFLTFISIFTKTGQISILLNTGCTILTIVRFTFVIFDLAMITSIAIFTKTAISKRMIGLIKKTEPIKARIDNTIMIGMVGVVT